MKNSFNLFLIVIISSLLSCGNSDIGKFTYEEINGEKYIAITKMNLVNLNNMRMKHIDDLLKDLGYEYEEKTSGRPKYSKTTEGELPNLQIITLVKNDEIFSTPFNITWSTFGGKDPFKKFVEEIEKQEINKKGNKDNTYIVKHNNKSYYAKITDEGLSKRIGFFSLIMK